MASPTLPLTGPASRRPPAAAPRSGGHRRHRRYFGLPRWLAWVIPLALSGAVLFGAGGCEREQAGTNASGKLTTQPPSEARTAESAVEGGAPRASSEEKADLPTILMLGDSLTAGFGLPEEMSLPSLLQKRLRAEGYPHRVINAGVSGDTSAGGLARLDWLLRQRVDVLVLALGANDGLRGLEVAHLRANLAKIIAESQRKGIAVVLAGMRMPVNYGAEYTRAFQAVYPGLAREFGLPLIPFLLEGVALRSDLNQADGIHPNAAGARIVAGNVWRGLKGVLER